MYVWMDGEAANPTIAAAMFLFDTIYRAMRRCASELGAPEVTGDLQQHSDSF